MFDGFQFPKTILVWMDQHSGAAGWMQAIIAGAAIISVYWAATVPVRAEAKRLEEERASRADGLDLLLISEIIVLIGELESAVESGTINDPPVLVSSTLMDRADQMYLMGERGRRLIQALGMINGVNAQTKRFHQVADEKLIPTAARPEVGADLWSNNAATYRLCLLNLNEVVAAINTA